MAVISNIVASLRAETKQFDRKIKSSRSYVRSLTADMARQQRQMMNYAKSVVGIYAMQRAFKSVTAAAMTQEKAQMSLAASLATTGHATRDNMKDFMAYAASMQKQTIFGDEDIAAQMAYGKNLGIVTDKLKEASTAAIGLAAKYNLDLKTSMMLVGRASQGQTTMLTRYGITLSDTLSDQEKFNELLRIGAASFDLAKAQAMTTEGRLIQLKNAFGDIQEVLGAKLLPTIVTFATKLASMDMSVIIENLETTLTVVKNIGLSVAGLYILKPIKALAISTGNAMLAMWSKTLSPATLVLGAIAGIGAGLYSLRTAWAQNFGGMRDKLQEFGESVKDAWDKITAIFGSAYQWVVANWNTAIQKLGAGLQTFAKQSAGTWAYIKTWWGMFNKGYAMWTDETQAILDKAAMDAMTRTSVKLDSNISMVTSKLKTAMGQIKDLTPATRQAFSELLELNIGQAKDDFESFGVWLEQKAPKLTQLFKPIKLDSLTSDDSLDSIVKKVNELRAGVGLPVGTDGASAVTEAANASAIDVVAARGRMYAQMEKMSVQAYQAQKALLDQDREDFRKNHIDKLAIKAWYDEQIQKLDIERYRSSNRVADGFKAAALQMERDKLNFSEQTFEIAMSTRDIMRQGLMDMAQDWKNWGDTVKGILEEVYWKAVQTAFVNPVADSLAAGMSAGISGALGGLFPSKTAAATTTAATGAYSVGGVNTVTGGVHHRGGLAGSASIATRQVPASTFNSAPRYHMGSDEVPAILQRGERVIPKGGPINRSNDIQVQVYHVGDGRGPVTTEQYADADRRILAVTLNDSQQGGQLAREIKRQARRAL